MAIAPAACLPRNSFGRTQAGAARSARCTIGASRRRVHLRRPDAATKERIRKAAARSSDPNRQVLEIPEEDATRDDAKSAEDDFLPEDSTDDEAEQGVIAPWTPNATTAAAAAAAFSVVAFDVESPMSLHLLLELDMAAHNFVSTNVPQGFQATVAEFAISDAAVTAACIGWVYACFQLLQQRSPSGLSRVVVGTTLMILGGGGSLVTGDPPIVHFLKQTFHRARPTDILHHSFSFPSGHTNAAMVSTGFLLFALLPAVAAHNTKDDESNDATEGDGAKGLLSVENRVALWAASGLITATGRVLADVHWVSDTMAGASLGVFLVSIGCITATEVERRLSKVTSEAETDDLRA